MLLVPKRRLLRPPLRTCRAWPWPDEEDRALARLIHDEGI
jgi:hypothetical protein